mmetsp:Transcript_7279/g.20545  ORF Transcript_7279/g.20545 Transcript_7279/m.20545 type:complete len:260 (-) Transcript_7279:284-1063(-)
MSAAVMLSKAAPIVGKRGVTIPSAVPRRIGMPSKAPAASAYRVSVSSPRFWGNRSPHDKGCESCSPRALRRGDDHGLSLWSSPLTDVMLPARHPMEIATRLLDEFPDFDRGLVGKLTRSSFPVDVVERDGEYVVTAEMPGLNEKDVTITMEGQVLTISGKHASEMTKTAGQKEDEEKDEEKSGRVVLYERRSRNFVRSFQLPKGIDEEGITAEMANGILTVTVPRKDLAPNGRTIPVTKAKIADPEDAHDAELESKRNE